MVSNGRASKSLMPRGRRAVSDDLKEIRRTAILDAALRLFRRMPFEAITMAEVAAEAGVAKGTVYLYFATKEALFLALLMVQFGDWFDALDAHLELPAAPAAAASAFTDWVVASLVARPLFVRLIAVMHSVLEHNIELETALPFKRMLALRVTQAGTALAARLGWSEPAAGMRVLLWLHGIVIGLQHMAAPAPVVRAAMRRDPALAIFDIDFATELRALLARVLAGMTATQGDTA